MLVGWVVKSLQEELIVNVILCSCTILAPLFDADSQELPPTLDVPLIVFQCLLCLPELLPVLGAEVPHLLDARYIPQRPFRLGWLFLSTLIWMGCGR